MPDVLAIVGSEHWPESSEGRVKELIRERLQADPPELVISGGCAGVDAWAIEVARALGMSYDYLNYLPENRRWEPKGFKARNIKIGRACTRMIAIRSVTSTRYGSAWTANYTRGLGKPVEYIAL